MAERSRFRPGIHQGPSVIGIIKNQVRFAMNSKKEYIFIAGTYSLIQSIAVGCFMVHAAITNNPQGEFYTESGVVWGLFLCLGLLVVLFFVRRYSCQLPF